MNELVHRSAGALVDLEQERTLQQMRVAAARAAAQIDAASAVYDAAAQYPTSATVTWLRNRYFRR